MLDNSVIVAEGKTGPRIVPLTTEAVRLLKQWLRRRAGLKTSKDSKYVFVSKYDPVCTPNGIGQSFRKHRARHKLANITPHTLRHAYCTYYLKNGGNMEKLRNITGHTSYEMLKEYLHMAEVGGTHAKEELERVSPLSNL